MLINIFYRIINYFYSIFSPTAFEAFRQRRRLRKKKEKQQRQQQLFEQDLIIYNNLNKYVNTNKYIDDVKILINIKTRIDNNKVEVELLRQKFHKQILKLLSKTCL